MITSREGDGRNFEVRLEIEILIIVPCIKIAKLFKMIIIRRYFSRIIYMRIIELKEGRGGKENSIRS